MVSFPHCEQFVRVSVFAYECPRDGPCDAPCDEAPSTDTRLPLQFLQRLGSFLNCLSWKNSCSPAVNTNSMPQSMHFKTLSWYSIEEALPARTCSARETRIGKDPVHIVGRRFTSPSCLPLGFGPPHGVHRMVTDLLTKTISGENRTVFASNIFSKKLLSRTTNGPSTTSERPVFP